MRCGECSVWGCQYRSTNSMQECQIRNVSSNVARAESAKHLSKEQFIKFGNLEYERGENNGFVKGYQSALSDVRTEIYAYIKLQSGGFKELLQFIDSKLNGRNIIIK